MYRFFLSELNDFLLRRLVKVQLKFIEFCCFYFCNYIFFISLTSYTNTIILIKIKNKTMKRLIPILAIAFMTAFGSLSATSYTNMNTNTFVTTIVNPVQDDAASADAEESLGFHQELKKRFIEGGPGFMGIVLLCLILGLAIAIERIIFLNLSTTNSKKLIDEVEGALASGGLDAAKEVCRNTKGPIASIFYQGLDRANEDLDAAEKAVVAYGGVQMGQLEKNVSWISLFIALAPMLGFMGTVIGMIQAFDKIEAAGDMQPSLVAGGIKVALLTTVFGLIVAIILQVFYNYIIAKIDSIVNNMEDSSISLMDILVKNKK
jgi:biopolymer transport protein ExbB